MENIKRVQLSEIAELITKGTTPTTLGYEFQDDGVNFLKIECFDELGNYLPDKVAHISEECNEKLKRSQLKTGDVLFSIAGAIGRVGIITEEMLPANTNQALAIIRINDDDVYLPYIKLILTSPIVKRQFERKKQGVAQLNLSLKNINEISIPLPNKEKQIEYAKLFTKISGILDRRNRELESLNGLIKARFVEMFVGKGLPETTVHEVLETGFWLMPATPDYVENGTVPYITSKNIKNREIDFENVKYISKQDYLRISANRPTKIGDILISMIGTLGQTAVITSNREFYGQNLYLLRLNGEIIDTDFFCEFFNSQDVQHKLQIKSNQSTQAYLKANHVEDLVLPLPPLDDQKRFAEFVNQVDKSKVVVQKSLDETQLLFDSLMQQYFG